MADSDQALMEQNFDAAMLDAADQAFDQNTDHQAEIQIGRLALMQGLSPEIANSVAGYKLGQIIHGVSREILSKPLKRPWLLERGVPEAEISPVECLAFIPVMKLPTEFIKWYPRDARPEGGLPYEWKTLDQNDPKVREGVFRNRGGTWGTNKDLHFKPDGKMKPPPVTDNINYLVLPVDYETKRPKANFCIATFARTSAQAGKDLTGEIANNKPVWGVRRWERLFYLWSDKNTDGKNVWQEYRCTPGPILQKFSADLIPIAAGMAIFMSSGEDKGLLRQQTLLNAAPLGEDSTGSNDDPNVVDGTSSGSTTTPTDPFKPDEPF